MEPLAQHVGQRAVVGFRDVGDFEFGGVGFGSGAHRADERQPALQRGGDQRQFRREGVDGVHHVVVARGVQ